MVERKVCVATGTRAEYGLLRDVMDSIKASERLELQIIATGMHLSPEFGLTYREIVSDGFHVDRKVEMLLSSDTPVGITKATGVGMIGLADALDQLSPDILVVLGDRFEILAVAIAALFARIPIAHIHGGETTAGAFDEAIRHSITKMSHLHFVATEKYRDRVIQLGENPACVFNVGGLGVDGIRRTKLLDREALEDQLGYKLGRRNLLITFHPVTLEDTTAEVQFLEMLHALDSLETDFHFIFTMPNADSDGRQLIKMVNEYVNANPGRATVHSSLGQLRYWSLLSVVDAVVGNSSSGLLEAPSVKTATVDIGDRQAGRLAGESVVHCNPDREGILDSILLACSDSFRKACDTVKSPYGNGGATEKIVGHLQEVDLRPELLKKRFFDLPIRDLC